MKSIRRYLSRVFKHVAALLLAMFLLGGEQRASAAQPAALGVAQAVEISRAYLASGDADERERLKVRLAGFRGQIEPVIEALSQQPHSRVKPGYQGDEKFETPRLREKYPKDWLYFVVPENYAPDRPTGLVIFMHGGGLNTTRDAAMYTLRFPTDESSDESGRSGDMLAATGMITVGPSAPGKGDSYYRWCLRASEDYLVDVIEECRQRFNIDPDRVFLLGHSMGGFGAYHHALRQPDRFAAIVISSGSWDRGYWPAVRGTPLCITQGVNDAVRGERWHHTDVEYARRTHEIFNREALEHVYHEHDGGHGFSGNRRFVAEYFAATQKLRRDPYYPHVALGTPQGFTWNYLHPVRHNRWLSLDETTPGKLQIDELDTEGEDFDEWRLIHSRPSRSGAAIEAVNQGHNRIDVTTQNVARCTVWLHPRMVDISQPVTITVDGQVRFRERLTPSLVTALASYERRRDWGMIYPMRVELRLADEAAGR